MGFGEVVAAGEWFHHIMKQNAKIEAYFSDNAQADITPCCSGYFFFHPLHHLAVHSSGSCKMNLRQSNKDAHPGQPDMASSQRRSLQQVANERAAKEQAKVKLQEKRNKSCQAVIDFEEELSTNRGIKDGQPKIMEKLPRPRHVAPKVKTNAQLQASQPASNLRISQGDKLDEENRKPAWFEC